MKLDTLFQYLKNITETTTERANERALFQAQRFSRDLGLALYTYQVREAADLILGFLNSLTHGHGHDHGPDASFVAKATAFARGLTPFMPETAARIFKLLNPSVLGAL